MTNHESPNIYSRILKWLKWRMIVPERLERKSVICVAPHTTNIDFPMGLLYYCALGRKPRFMMKKEWFFFPLGYLLKALGGFPINRSQNRSTVDVVAQQINSEDDFNIAITPEGSRSLRETWRTGFYHIAMKANIPIELAYIDYKNKTLGIFETFHPTGDIDADIAYIRSRYHAGMAKFPEKFAEL